MSGAGLTNTEAENVSGPIFGERHERRRVGKY